MIAKMPKERSNCGDLFVVVVVVVVAHDWIDTLSIGKFKIREAIYLSTNWVLTIDR